MVRDDDDEALSWGGEELDHVAARPATVAAAESEATDAAPASSSVLLVVYGIFAGAYLLFTVGWVIAVTRSAISQAGLFAEIMYQLGEFLAIASPVLWFGAVFLLTRDSRAVWRVLWLVVGLVVVAPWPFILGGSL